MDKLVIVLVVIGGASLCGAVAALLVEWPQITAQIADWRESRAAKRRYQIYREWNPKPAAFGREPHVPVIRFPSRKSDA